MERNWVAWDEIRCMQKWQQKWLQHDY